ncbi:MAG TPA: SAM-dependent methyltransferase [Thermoplasmata archaeon]|nr:SAM-dependent methyltransferase [Thermoplasmata archaeon]
MSDPAPSVDPESVERRRRLLDLLEKDARPDGFVPFDRFMERALFADGLGFYARDRSPFGPGGDFYTAAHVSPLFAASLAARIEVAVNALAPCRQFRVVELGPGDGTLAAGILGALAARGLGSAVHDYVLVERSAPLREASLARAKSAAEPEGPLVRAGSSIGEDGPFSGVVVANELLDAQPARRFRRAGGEWRELGVRRDGDRLRPAEGAILQPVPGPRLPEVPEGTVVEVSPAAEALVREVGDHLSHGLCIFLDYGMEEEELVSGHPGGTLDAVRRHQFETDPLEFPGDTDLSVFVNFTRIRAAARAAGLREVTFAPQNEALGRWGFPALLEAALRRAGSSEAEVKLRLAAKNLLFGFERFRVLELVSPSALGGTTGLT